MAKYFPLLQPTEFKASDSGMVALSWKWRALAADFVIPHSDNVLRVEFDDTLVVRIADEMPLATEVEPLPDEGLVAGHVAYRVEGAAFWSIQFAVLQLTDPNAQHYRFLTGWDCLDVVSNSAPILTVASNR